MRGSQSLPDLSQENQEQKSICIRSNYNGNTGPRDENALKSPTREPIIATPEPKSPLVVSSNTPKDYTPPSEIIVQNKDDGLGDEISEEIVFNPISSETQDDITEHIMDSTNRSMLFVKARV